MAISISSLKLKFENENVLKNYDRNKATQLNPMILVSFFPDENALSDKTKTCDTLGFQSSQIPPFSFFGTPGMCSCVSHTAQ